MSEQTVIKGYARIQKQPGSHHPLVWFYVPMDERDSEHMRALNRDPATIILGNGISEETMRKMLEEIMGVAERYHMDNGLSGMLIAPGDVETIASKYGIEL